MRPDRRLALGPAVLIGAWAAASSATDGAAVIDLEVRYPAPGQMIAPDSNFVFGSVGSGAATLQIDGRPVDVESNGAFLAWLPVPDPESGTEAAYSFVVVEGADTVRASHPIRRPLSAPPPGAARPWLQAEVLEGPTDRWYESGEDLDVTVVGEAGLTASLEAGEFRFPLADLGPVRGSLVRYGARIDPERLHAASCRAGRCRAGSLVLPGVDGDSLRFPLDTVFVDLVAADGGLEVRREIAFRLAPRPAVPPRARLLEAEDEINGQSGVIVGRPTRSGPYRWRFPEGTLATVRTKVGNRVALDLGADLTAWVDSDDVRWEPVAFDPSPARVYAGRATSSPDGLDFRLGVSSPGPAELTQTGPRSLRLTVHDALGELDRVAHGSETGVAAITWTQVGGPAVHIDIELDWPVWGHRLTVEAGDAREYEGPRTGRPLEPGEAMDGGAILRLSIRRPPAIDSTAPLRGRRIAVDPGHPGAGSYGPTGLFEGDANLAVARRLAELLTDAGATPVMVRTDRSPVGLYERTQRAREADAELFVSIHNNAFPDGVNPFELAGTSTFYYHPRSAALARAVQTALVRRIGLRDLGPLWGDLAVVREPWMPAVLAEGAFMMVPEHEAALRTPEFRERYARGLFEGIEAFLAQFTEQP